MTTKYYIIYTLLVCFVSCSKESFLNEKPDKSMSVPSTLEHFQAMLDNDAVMNGAEGYFPWFPGMLEVASDNVYYLDNDFRERLDDVVRNVYTWSINPYPAMDVNDWNRPYSVVLTANVILEGIEHIEQDASTTEQMNNIKGSALFYRSFAHYMLANTFAAAYEKENAVNMNGIPLRLNSSLEIDIRMNTLEETYQRIVSDLLTASSLLPVDPLYKTRPSKRAAMALLSRVFLSMSDYDRSYLYADSCLSLNNDLLDYNDYPTTTNYPFSRFNDEVIINFNMIKIGGTTIRVDSSLYRSYHDDDLRKVLFFKKFATDNTFRFFGNYDGTTYFFCGLANDEVLLNRAECSVRKGNTEQALADLNRLLSFRWRSVNGVSKFVPYQITDKEELLALILIERRKELIWRGVRWIDLKRLNLEGKHGTNLQRLIEGEVYQLSPNSDRYIFPIPDPVIELNPGILDR